MHDMNDVSVSARLANSSLTSPVDRRLLDDLIGPRDGAGKTAVVAMSGGVDSAVTALIMRERGYRVVGMNLRLFSPGDPEHSVNPCCGIPAMDDARATCRAIGVPFYAINMEAEFGEAVVDRFVDEYAAGRTPNPCLECNRHVKFRHLVQRAKALGADCLATGHYARIVHEVGSGGQGARSEDERGRPETGSLVSNADTGVGEPLAGSRGRGPDDRRSDPSPNAAGGRYRLLRAVDDRKDQSYVLHTLDQEQLAFLRFPLGGLIKPRVRELARAFGLPVADKAESQEICFVGKGSYADFVAKRRPDVTRPGEIVDAAGTVVGEHRGLVHHTVGQRRGIRVAGPRPLYVLELAPASNRLVVGGRDEAVARGMRAEGVAMVDGSLPDDVFACDVVVRYRGQPTPASIRFDPAQSGTAEIALAGDPAGWPIASPGQAVVFYRGDEVLGGGTIQSVERAARGPA